MKKYVMFAVLLFSCAIVGTSQTTEKAKKPVKTEKKQIKPAAKAEAVVTPAKFVGDSLKPITFDNLTIERNDIPKGTNDLFSFRFRNTGVQPLLIQNVQTSCGCTTASKPEAPIQPGDYSEISVKYDTHRMGQFVKTITITTNVGEPIVLTIKGSVLTEDSGETAPAH